MKRIVAQHDPTLVARVVRCTPLLYEAGADPETERPGHVRAGSSLAPLAGRIAVVEDDANFIALIAPESRRAAYIRLPAGQEGHRAFDSEHGNKRYKLDLEACVMIPGPHGVEWLVAFGSGSSREREQIVVLTSSGKAPPGIRVYEAPALYALLREEHQYSGSELNMEGAIYLPDGTLRLFQRGNGEPRDGLQPVNATCDLHWATLWAYLQNPVEVPAPAPTDIVQYELGNLQGVPLGFSDAELYEDVILFSASSEESVPEHGDGRVTGSTLGVIDDCGARLGVLMEHDGKTFSGKVEGLHLSPGKPHLVYFIVDADDPDKPSELYEAELSGPWYTRNN